MLGRGTKPGKACSEWEEGEEEVGDRELKLKTVETVEM